MLPDNRRDSSPIPSFRFTEYGATGPSPTGKRGRGGLERGLKEFTKRAGEGRRCGEGVKVGSSLPDSRSECLSPGSSWRFSALGAAPTDGHLTVLLSRDRDQKHVKVRTRSFGWRASDQVQTIGEADRLR